MSVLFAVLDNEKKWSVQHLIDDMDGKFEEEKQQLIDASMYKNVIQFVSAIFNIYVT